MGCFFSLQPRAPPCVTETRPRRTGWGFLRHKGNTSESSPHPGGATPHALWPSRSGRRTRGAELRADGGAPGEKPSLPGSAAAPGATLPGHPDQDEVAGAQGAPSCGTPHLQAPGPLTCGPLPGVSTLGCCPPAPALRRAPSQTPAPPVAPEFRLLDWSMPTMNKKLVLALSAIPLFLHSDPPHSDPRTPPRTPHQDETCRSSPHPLECGHS